MSKKTHHFRPEIQGLRALAVLVVVFYHCGVQLLPGGFIGVDVFFVISGFLITQLLLREFETNRFIDFKSFWSRRVRRIIPASTVTIFLTLLASVIFLPPLRLMEVFKDAIPTSLFVPNIYFAFIDKDYLADKSPSVFQQYWSLGVEEQFYIFWPFVILISCYFALRFSRNSLLFIITTISAVSFVGCIYLTITSPPNAFFSPLSRAWEFGAGAILAVFESRAKNETKLKKWKVIVKGISSWLGLAVILLSCLTFSENINFPGPSALLPVFGSVFTIWGASGDSKYSAKSFLSLRIFQTVGAISFSVYLIHWPLITIPILSDDFVQPVPFSTIFVLTLLSFPLGYLLYRYVENPFRYSTQITRQKPSNLIILSGLNAVLMAAIATLGVFVISNTKLYSSELAATSSLSEFPTGNNIVPQNMKPSLTEARDDVPILYFDGCHLDDGSQSLPDCTFGNNSSAPKVYLFGDSHAAQWFPALKELADNGKITLVTRTKSSCPSVRLDLTSPRYNECTAWYEKVLIEVGQEMPELIVMSNYSQYWAGNTPGAIEKWSQQLESGLGSFPADSKVLFISDTPNLSLLPTDCLSSNLNNAGLCSIKRSKATSIEIQNIEKGITSKEDHNVFWIQLNDYLCNKISCPLIIGDTLVYRDLDHLTATMSLKFKEVLGKKIQDLLVN